MGTVGVILNERDDVNALAVARFPSYRDTRLSSRHVNGHIRPVDLAEAPEGRLGHGSLENLDSVQNHSMEPQSDRRRGGIHVQALLELPANRHKGELFGREQRVHLALRVKRPRTHQGLAELNPHGSWSPRRR